MSITRSDRGSRLAALEVQVRSPEFQGVKGRGGGLGELVLVFERFKGHVEPVCGYRDLRNLGREDDFFRVLYLAARVNRRLRRKADKCGSFYADIRPCREDCAFCPLSKDHYVGIDVKGIDWDRIPAAIRAFAERIVACGVGHFKIVTTGAKSDSRIIPFIAEGVRGVKRHFPHLTICVSEGTLTRGALMLLRRSGVDIFNNNLETSRERFSRIVKTHTYDEKIKAIKTAKAVGMRICSGGLFGIGETLRERMDLFLTLNRLGVDSSPFNLFVRYPGLPLTLELEKSGYRMKKTEIFYSLAVFRLINPRTRLVLGAGRGDTLTKDEQAFALLVGATSLASSGYLTKSGVVFSARKDDSIFAKAEEAALIRGASPDSMK